MDGGTCVMVSMSVDCPNVNSVSGSVRGQTFASHFCLQPRGSTGCRLTYFSHADIRYHFSSCSEIVVVVVLRFADIELSHFILLCMPYGILGHIPFSPVRHC